MGAPRHSAHNAPELSACCGRSMALSGAHGTGRPNDAEMHTRLRAWHDLCGHGEAGPGGPVIDGLEFRVHHVDDEVPAPTSWRGGVRGVLGRGV